MTSRKTRTILALAIVAAVFGYKYLAPKHGGEDAAATDARPARAVEPARPTMLGSIAFEPCTLSSAASRSSLEAQCASFEVPEDHANPEGRKLALNIAWLEATSRGEVAPDPVFFIAGGPGQSAVETFPAMNQVFADVRKSRHVVLVDQRGTGKSNLLACKAGDPEAVPTEASMEAAAQECVRELSKKADLRFYTTTDAVADLEDVRKAIGAPALNLVGVSYGTRVAQQYAMRHPQSTRSIVLDSSVPNTIKLGNIFARNLEDALALQFSLCTRNPACNEALGDPRAELDQLLDKLRAAPVAVTYRDATTGEQATGTLRAETVAGLVRMYAYMPQAAGLLPKLIHEANNGRYDGLMALAKMLQDDMSDAMAMGMQMSVVCSEDHDAMVAREEDAGTVLGNLMPQSMAAMCRHWPKGQVPADFNKALATAVPALVVHGEFDPVTPPRYGEEVVKSLPNGRLLVLRGAGHSVLGSGCMPRLFAQFVEKADAKSLDGKCLDSLAYSSPFISFNGAEP